MQLAPESHQKVADHYEKYPYPSYPIFVLGSWKNLSSVDLSCWPSKVPIREAWIAGCGSIAPAMFGRRNPRVRFVASDLSKNSLSICRRRLILNGVRNVILRQEDLAATKYNAEFDAVDAFGVLHHTQDPVASLKRLAGSLRPGGVLRLMIYSDETRGEIESLRTEVKERSLTSVNLIHSFLKQRKQKMTGDLSDPMGIADALLHPLVHTYTRAELEDLLDSEESLETIRIDSKNNFIVFMEKK